MDISFKNRKLEKSFIEEAKLVKNHGALRAKKIKIRMAALRAAMTLTDFWPPKSPPDRCHELPEGKRRGQLSVDLDYPYRLIFVPDHEPVPQLQDGGLDTVEANEKLGFAADLRDYGIGAQILADLGIKKIKLMTNNPKKIVGLEGYGIEIVERVALEVPACEHSRKYLETKKTKMGHMFEGEDK